MAWYHPLLLRVDAETAHAATIRLLRGWGGAGAPFAVHAARFPRLATQVAGLHFANPVGLAAGVDKNAEALRGLWALGFGAVEVGTLTLRAQPGNPRPRLFRLSADRAVVNRYGFNNGGLTAALARLPAARPGLLGINVGANKDTADRIADYARACHLAAPHADYLTINISSPNTPGLRDLQAQPLLGELIAACRVAAGSTPLFLKVAPDLDRPGIDAVVRAAIDGAIDALIVGNTTISRPAGLGGNAREAGGLSGKPLALLARAKLAEARSASGGTLALIAAGGVDSAQEAYARIRAGASLVQLYTALVYEGPGLVARILSGLDALLARDGFGSVGEAVGSAPQP